MFRFKYQFFSAKWELITEFILADSLPMALQETLDKGVYAITITKA